MGASAAVMYGALLDADVVIAYAPELEMGLPGFRSDYLNSDKRMSDAHRKLHEHLKLVGNRAQLMFPAYDLADWHQAAIAMETGADYLWGGTFHPTGWTTRWAEFFAADSRTARVADFVVCDLFEPLHHDHMHLGGRVFREFYAQNYDMALQIALPLFELLPSVGIATLLSMISYAKGDPAHGDFWLRQAISHDKRNLLTEIRLNDDFHHCVPVGIKDHAKQRLNLFRAAMMPAGPAEVVQFSAL